MSVRYVATCDGCGQEQALQEFSDWGQVQVREPGNVLMAAQHSFDFCSPTCLWAWWQDRSLREAWEDA